MILHCWVFTPRWSLYDPVWPRSVCLNSPLMVSRNEDETFFEQDVSELRKVFQMPKPCEDRCCYAGQSGRHTPYFIHFPSAPTWKEHFCTGVTLTVDTRLKEKENPYDSEISVSYTLESLVPESPSGFQYSEKLILGRPWFLTEWLRDN